MTPGDEGYDVAKPRRPGLHRRAHDAEARGREGRQGLRRRADRGDRSKLSRQIDEILHHPHFQKLESAWRGLKFVVDRTDFRENIKVEMLNCSKEDLLADFEDSPEVPKSGLYKLVYSAEYGQFGGKPVGAIVSNYEFGPGPQDIALLQKCASVATMAHAPFIAAAGPQFFGLKRLPEPAEPEGPQVASSRARSTRSGTRSARRKTRATSASLLPRFLLRLPYGANTVPVKAFNYEEDVIGRTTRTSGATRLRVRDARRRQLRQVPLVPEHHRPAGRRHGREPAAPPVRGDGRDPDEDPDRDHAHGAPRVRAVARRASSALTFRKDSDNACFFSANSCRSRSTSARAPRAARRSSTTASARSSRTCSS
jgi:type VI secretion system protein ImpC